jgi:hypothetical protein
VTDALDNRVLIAEAKIARQREEIARLKARGRILPRLPLY